MNEGKLSGFTAGKKENAGARTKSRPKRGQAGVGPTVNRLENSADIAQVDQSELRSMSRPHDPVLNPFPDLAKMTSSNGQKKVVSFQFTGSDARRVCIAGTFNDWHPDATEMISLGGGQWRKDLLLAPGEYQYRLVVDGEWMCDPNCGEEAPNGFGEKNSILTVNDAAEQ